MQYYVYEHWRPDTGLPFYVGKGKGGRVNCTQRNKYYVRVVNKLKRNNLEIEVRKVFSGLDEEMAFALEKSQIAYWRARGIALTNATDGGEGISGYRFSDAQKQHMSKVIKDLPPEVWAVIKAAVSKARKNHTPSDETRKLMSISQTGRKHLEETKQKMRIKALEREAMRRELGLVQQGHLGFKHSAATKQEMRLIALARGEVSAATKEKLRDAVSKRSRDSRGRLLPLNNPS
jgi:hypothetical protein